MPLFILINVNKNNQIVHTLPLKGFSGACWPTGFDPQQIDRVVMCLCLPHMHKFLFGNNIYYKSYDDSRWVWDKKQRERLKKQA